jgi:5-methyltetrahydrofolate--homocysteine methyltransferase
MPKLNFTAQDWERIEQDNMAWWAGELDRPLVYLAATDPLPPPARFDFLTNYPLSMSVEEIVDHYEQAIAATHYYGDAFPWWWINFGPGMAAGFLGARVNSVAEPSETVWFTPPEKIDVRQLDLRYDAENAWWKRVKALTAAAVERWQGQAAISYTDLGGNLDILASFCGSDGLLFDLVDHPQEVDRLVKDITGLWLRYYTELDAIIRPTCRGTSTWAPLWTTGQTYMLQSDFCYMISPAMFERFVLPDLSAICAALDYAFYHLDGKGEIPHLDMLLGLARLRGIQWIPGDGQPTPDQWLPLLKRIRDGGKLCQVFVRPEGARRIVKNLGGKGFLLVIDHEEDEFLNPEDAQAFLKVLDQEDMAQ